MEKDTYGGIAWELNNHLRSDKGVEHKNSN